MLSHRISIPLIFRRNFRRKHWPATALLGLAASILFAPASRAQTTEAAGAADVTRLAPVQVPGQLPVLAPRMDERQTYSATTVDGAALRWLGSPAQTNPWTALKMAPSVNFQNADAYGMGRPFSMRLRGKSASHIGRTVEGVPMVVEPGGGADLFDMENMGSVTLLRGAVPADKGLGLSNSGMVNVTLRGPEEEFGVRVSQTVGAENLRRSYARVDTGALGSTSDATAGATADAKPDGPLRMFLSASDTRLDKWRGPGNSKRQNVEAGLALNFSPRVQAEVFAVHHDVGWHTYRALSYAQMNTQMGGDLDYNAALSGNAQADAAYYGFNRNHHISNAVLGKLTVRTFDGARLLFKPHYWKENGWSLTGQAASGQVRYWEMTHYAAGFDLNHDVQTAWGGWTAGWWYHISQAPPPPTAWRQYAIQPDGSLQFAGWSRLAQATLHRYSDPYATLTWKVADNVADEGADITLDAGLRYTQYQEPHFTFYQGNTAPDVSYKEVFRHNPQRDPALFTRGRTFRAWLPNMGLSWAVNPDWTVRASYGRTYGGQNWGQATTAFSGGNRQGLEAAGVSLNDIWNGLRPEMSNALDLSARLDFERGYVMTTLYHTRYQHKQLALYDASIINPQTGQGVSYHRSVASATARGVEVEAGLTPVRNLELYLSWTFNRAAYDADVQTVSSSVVPIKGKQMQDAARHMGKLNVIWQPGNWMVMAGVRYLGKRFGDTLEREKVSAYTLVDAGLGVSLGKAAGMAGLRELDVHLSVSNLFDKRHIGIISASDYTVGGGTSYMPGAPRTVSLNVSGRF